MAVCSRIRGSVGDFVKPFFPYIVCPDGPVCLAHPDHRASNHSPYRNAFVNAAYPVVIAFTNRGFWARLGLLAGHLGMSFCPARKNAPRHVTSPMSTHRSCLFGPPCPNRPTRVFGCPKRIGLISLRRDPAIHKPLFLSLPGWRLAVDGHPWLTTATRPAIATDRRARAAVRAIVVTAPPHGHAPRDQPLDHRLHDHRPLRSGSP